MHRLFCGIDLELLVKITDSYDLTARITNKPWTGGLEGTLSINNHSKQLIIDEENTNSFTLSTPTKYSVMKYKLTVIEFDRLMKAFFIDNIDFYRL